MTKYLYTFLTLTALILAGCNKAKEEPQKEVYHGARTIPTEIVDKGNQAVQNANKRDAGFVNNRVNEVTLTSSCFGAVNANNLDILPRPNETSRKDSTVIDQLNQGEVFLLQPGTKGIMLTDAGSKLLVRFQMGELWIWKSAVK